MPHCRPASLTLREALRKNKNVYQLRSHLECPHEFIPVEIDPGPFAVACTLSTFALRRAEAACILVESSV
jgi:hypothetical protein